MITLPEILSQINQVHQTSVIVFWDLPAGAKTPEFSHYELAVTVTHDTRKTEKVFDTKIGGGIVHPFLIDNLEEGLTLYKELCEHFKLETPDISQLDTKCIDTTAGELFLMIYTKCVYKRAA